MPARPDVRQRHREQRLNTRRRILDSALGLLEDRPWSEVAVAEITRRSGVTRTAFYRHFGDQQQLLLALLEDVGLRLDLVADPWERGEGDPDESLAGALRELAAVFARHGRLIGAIADAATQDPAIAAVYRELGARLSASAAQRIALEVAAGRSRVGDPEEVAAALVWMNERFLLDRFGRPPLGDEERAAAALIEVWSRTLYGDGPGVSGSARAAARPRRG